MGTYNLNLKDVDIDEITLNQHGDKIFVSGDDASLWDNFCKGYKKISDMADEMPNKIDQITKKFANTDGEISIEHAVEISKVRVEFCENAISVIDGIFGEGTAKKSFRDYYDTISDFLPDEDKFIAFFETMTPIMEDIFKKKMKRQEAASKARMAKYQPQDHKRPKK